MLEEKKDSVEQTEESLEDLENMGLEELEKKAREEAEAAEKPEETPEEKPEKYKKPQQNENHGVSHTKNEIIHRVSDRRGEARIHRGRRRGQNPQ